MKVLIVKCYSTTKPWGGAQIDSFTEHIRRSQSSAAIDVCGLVDGDVLPDPLQYDLVIFTGGTFNLIADKPLLWVESALSCIRNISELEGQETKLLGFCWGHQAIHFALGGELGVLGGGPRVGVENIKLLQDGKELFPGASSFGSWKDLHKFHKRIVATPAPGFIPLAANNEIFLSTSRQILTFQSHPEFSEILSRDVMADSRGAYDMDSSSHADVDLKDISHAHDGKEVWNSIMEWYANSENSGTNGV